MFHVNSIQGDIAVRKGNTSSFIVHHKNNRTVKHHEIKNGGMNNAIAESRGGSDSTLKRKILPSAISALSAEDQILFERFGQGEVVDLPFECIHHAFESMALKQPESIAAVHLGKSISYGQLNAQANRLALLLQQQGVKPGDHVALFVKRSLSMLVGILAVLKVGAAYVPQDIGVAPSSQLSYVLDKAGIRVVLGVEEFRTELPLSDQHIFIDLNTIETDSKTELVINHDILSHEPIASQHTAFVIFTSGTTGNPNGVRVSHKNVCNILLVKPGHLNIQPGDKVAQILNIAFDMAAWEILACLSHGATLVIRGDDIAETVKQVDIVIATPTILSRLETKHCKTIKTVAVAGEPCPKPLADKWAQFCCFHNSCGPTETTIINTLQAYSPSDGRLTIGSPTPNNTVYILNEQREPCTIGETGEMWAGGDCVTGGYINNDTLTQERYVPDPFLGKGYYMFRTKDLGRWTRDGQLEHLGRVDDQVKVRGFRVELDSVSHIIEEIPGCLHAVTLLFDAKNLVAFIESESLLCDEQVKQHVAKHLPYYCVPTWVLVLRALPMTSRGKVDKRQLLQLAENYVENGGSAERLTMEVRV